MQRVLRQIAIGLGAWCVALLPTLAGQPPSQVAGVDNTRMGAYRALAHLSFEAYKSRDMVKAAELARILERTWDAAEEAGGPNSLGVKNKDLFEQIDKSMDSYIKPILQYPKKAPDPAGLEAAYKAFLEKLSLGDQ